MQPTQPPQIVLPGERLLSYVASAASIGLALFAIWQATVFYRLSARAQEAANSAISQIDTAVQRIESLYDRLYKDLFSITRDTVTDIRAHIWSRGDGSQAASTLEAETRAELEQVRESLRQEVARITAALGTTDSRVQGLRDNLVPLVERALEEGRRLDTRARTNAIQEFILTTLRASRTGHRFITADDLVSKGGHHFPSADILHELRTLEEEGAVVLSSHHIEPDTIIRLGAGPDDSESS